MNNSRRDALNQRAHANPRCAECVSRLDSPEVYTVTRHRDNALLAFDIELAHEFCQDGRAPQLIETEILDAILQVNGITAEHIDHVDPSFPGIACPVDYTPEGQPVLGLIDGSHRAARCRREHRPFFAFHLTREEAERCQQTEAAQVCGFLERVLRTATPMPKSSH
jgi:hypothetical protein